MPFVDVLNLMNNHMTNPCCLRFGLVTVVLSKSQFKFLSNLNEILEYLYFVHLFTQ